LIFRVYWGPSLPALALLLVCFCLTCASLGLLMGALLRSPEQAGELGNKFGLVFLSLPVNIPDPVFRLRELKRRMDEIKHTPEAVVAFGILGAIGMAVSEIQDLVVDIFGTKGTAVMTNVPGPREQLYFAGAPLREIMCWVPQSGHLGLGVSIISYAGKVWLGVATDINLVPDPERIISEFDREFQGMLAMANEKKSKPSARIKPMMTLLDQALDSLDEAIESAKAQPPAKPVSQPGVCTALTRSGQPCKNRPLEGSTLCRQHQPKLETVPK